MRLRRPAARVAVQVNGMAGCRLISDGLWLLPQAACNMHTKVRNQLDRPVMTVATIKLFRLRRCQATSGLGEVSNWTG